MARPSKNNILFYYKFFSSLASIHTFRNSFGNDKFNLTEILVDLEHRIKTD